MLRGPAVIATDHRSAVFSLSSESKTIAETYKVPRQSARDVIMINDMKKD